MPTPPPPPSPPPVPPPPLSARGRCPCCSPPPPPPATPKSATASRRGVSETIEREARDDDSAKAGARANRRAGDSGRSDRECERHSRCGHRGHSPAPELAPERSDHAGTFGGRVGARIRYVD